MMAWLEAVVFVVVEVLSLVGAALGYLILPIPCALQAWHDVPSQFDAARTIDAWDWEPLNAVFGNPEDGVSGRYAMVWDNGAHVKYMDGRNPVWRAMCWSIGRNSADELKYVFRWRGSGPAPILRGTWLGGREWKAGWQVENGTPVPVLSF